MKNSIYLTTKISLVCALLTTPLYPMKNLARFKNLSSIDTTTKENLNIPSSHTPREFTPSSPAYSSQKTEPISPSKRLEWFLDRCNLTHHQFANLTQKQLLTSYFFSKKLIEEGKISQDLLADHKNLGNYIGNSLLKNDLQHFDFQEEITKSIQKKGEAPPTKITLKEILELDQIPTLIVKSNLSPETESILAVAWNNHWDDGKILVFNETLNSLPTQSIKCSHSPTHMLWSPKNSFLSLHNEDSIEIWNKKTGTFLCAPIKIPGTIEKVIWAPNEKTIAIQSNHKDTITYLTLLEVAALATPTKQNLTLDHPTELNPKIGQWLIDRDDDSINTIRFSPKKHSQETYE